MKHFIPVRMVMMTTAMIVFVLVHSHCKKDHPSLKKAEAIIDATQSSTPVKGLLSFRELSNGHVQLELSLTVASRAGQSVAVHIHEHGDCGNGGSNAHGHWNPRNQQHGQWGGASFHAGDIGNIPLDINGKGSLTIETNLWSIGGDSTTNILHRGIIVHGGVDDFTTQPTGNAGPRIGCGMIMETH